MIVLAVRNDERPLSIVKLSPMSNRVGPISSVATVKRYHGISIGGAVTEHFVSDSEIEHARAVTDEHHDVRLLLVGHSAILVLRAGSVNGVILSNDVIQATCESRVAGALC